LHTELSKFRAAAEAVFSDVRPELCDVSSVISNLREFRTLQFEKYRAGYVSVSLPQILELFVGVDVWVLPLMDKVGVDRRTDMIHSLNSCQEAMTISRRPWFGPIFDYSTDVPTTTDSAKNSVSEQDNDETLLPRVRLVAIEQPCVRRLWCMCMQVVIRSLFPWTRDYVDAALDPMSSTQMEACRELIEDLLDFDPTPQQIEPVLTACAHSLTRALNRICLPVLKMATQAGVSFMLQQVDALTTLLQNSAMLSSVVSPQALCQIAWKSLSEKAPESLVWALKCTDVSMSTFRLTATLTMNVVVLSLVFTFQVRIFNAAVRFCKAVLKLIPSRAVVRSLLAAQSKGTAEADVESFFSSISVPISAHNVLKSLVLNEMNESSSSDTDKAGFEFYRVSLQKFLRQVPMMK
jgi:hypothetical protein